MLSENTVLCAVSWSLRVLGLSVQKQAQHTHAHTLPPPTCPYQLADTPGLPASARKMERYRGNHMELA